MEFKANYCFEVDYRFYVMKLLDDKRFKSEANENVLGVSVEERGVWR